MSYIISLKKIVLGDHQYFCISVSCTKFGRRHPKSRVSSIYFCLKCGIRKTADFLFFDFLGARIGWGKYLLLRHIFLTFSIYQ